jgi:hypothetical protein
LETSATVTPPFDARLAIRQDDGVNVLTWTGGGQLQRADRVEGPWQTLATAQSVSGRSKPARSGRIKTSHFEER